MSFTLTQVRDNLRQRLDSNGSSGLYDAEITSAGRSDFISLYDAGTRKSFLGKRYGGVLRAKVEVVLRDTQRRYENGTIGTVQSRIDGISDLDLRLMAEGRYEAPEKKNGKSDIVPPTTGVGLL
ncbi:MAG TPA: hypothetical protein VHA12_00110 [Candidatus Nanoarchaeia archaeon]|nr:hypothetical protein [Candidatus Nanoarchaeia archaeon]